MTFAHDQRLGGSPGQQREIRKLGGLFRLIREGDCFPRGYGIAWRDWQSLRVWTCPVPLNLVVAAARWLWFAVVHGLRPHAFELAVINEVARRQQLWDEVVRRAREDRDLARSEAVMMKALAEDAGRRLVDLLRELREARRELEVRRLH